MIVRISACARFASASVTTRLRPASATFHAPLQIGDVVHTHVGVSKIGGKSAGFLVRMTRGDEAVAEVEVVWVAIDQAHASVALPEELRDWLYSFLD